MASEGQDSWFAVRVLIEPGDRDEPGSDTPDHFEDRFILVHAASEDEALTKGMLFAEDGNDDYHNAEGQTVRWSFRHIIDAHQILDSTLQDGTELYSAFIDRELAAALMRGGDSPVKAWLRQHPGADPIAATVEELLDAWETRDTSE